MKNPNTSKKITVLQLIDTGGPGGAETVFSQLVYGLGSTEYRCIPVVPREGWLSQRIRSGGIEPKIVESSGSMEWGYLSRLRKLVAHERVDVIHGHLLGSATYAAMLSLLTGVPVVATFHGPTDLSSSGRLLPLKKWLIRKHISAVVAVSESTRDALVEYGIPENLVTLVNNGVDTELFVPGKSGALREELGLTSDQIVFGSVGNIRKPKSYDILIRAAAMVLKVEPKAIFVIAGSGSEEQLAPLKVLSSDLGISESVHFLGMRPASSELYQGFDVFVSSSSSEGLPLSMLEAMACGRPIVSTASGGAQQALGDSQRGTVVPVGDPKSLSLGLLRMATDSTLRQQYSKLAREHVMATYSLSTTISSYKSIYTKIL
jgi:glycosyltransferase involved in cell wall biosynthesis